MKLFHFDQPFLDPYLWRYCFHHGKSDTQKTAEANSAADRASRDKLTGTAQGTLSQFEGPVQNSPFYKALKTTGIEQTSRSYDNARSGMREKANLSGFGYSSPTEQGADRELGARESSDLARVPGEAMLAASEPALRAAGTTGNMGMGYGNQAVGYFGHATDLEKQRQSDSLWNKLWGVYQNAAQGAASGAAAGM